MFLSFSLFLSRSLLTHSSFRPLIFSLVLILALSSGLDVCSSLPVLLFLVSAPSLSHSNWLSFFRFTKKVNMTSKPIAKQPFAMWKSQKARDQNLSFIYTRKRTLSIYLSLTLVRTFHCHIKCGKTYTSFRLPLFFAYLLLFALINTSNKIQLLQMLRRGSVAELSCALHCMVFTIWRGALSVVHKHFRSFTVFPSIIQCECELLCVYELFALR